MKKHVSIALILLAFSHLPAAQVSLSNQTIDSSLPAQASSPAVGEPAAEYAQLMEQLEDGSGPPEVSPQLRETVFLLRFRKLIRTLIPFAPL